MGTMSVQSSTLWLTLEIANGIFTFLTEKTGAKKLQWQQH